MLAIIRQGDKPALVGERQVSAVPADGNQRGVAATLDAARALIAEADAAERVPATAHTETIAREWWARRQLSAPRRPIGKVEVVRSSPTSPSLSSSTPWWLAILGLVVARAVNILR